MGSVERFSGAGVLPAMGACFRLMKGACTCISWKADVDMAIGINLEPWL